MPCELWSYVATSQGPTRSWGRGGQRVLPASFRWSMALSSPWSQTLGLQNREIIPFCCLSPTVCGTLLWQPQQTITGLVPCIQRTAKLEHFYIIFLCSFQNCAQPTESVQWRFLSKWMNLSRFPSPPFPFLELKTRYLLLGLFHSHWGISLLPRGEHPRTATPLKVVFLKNSTGHVSWFTASHLRVKLLNQHCSLYSRHQ